MEENKEFLYAHNIWFYIAAFVLGYTFSDVFSFFVGKAKNIFSGFEHDRVLRSDKFSKEILQGLFRKNKQVHPVIIVGGGCAGYTSANYLALSGLTPLMLVGKNPGGAIYQSNHVRNWPGEILIEGNEITKKLESQAKHNGAVILNGQAVDIDLDSWPYKVSVIDNVSKEQLDIYGCAIILCMGATPNKLDVPGCNEYWGRGVTNCAICDSALVKNKTAIVVGGGNSAMAEAFHLAGVAKEVVVVVRAGELRATDSMKDVVKDLPNVRMMFNSEVSEIIGDNYGVKSVLIKSNKDASKITKLSADGVFLAVGSIPNTSLVSGKVAVNDDKTIRVNRAQETSLPGVFAAGDICEVEFRQAVVAAGAGCKASLSALNFLRGLGIDGHLFKYSKKENRLRAKNEQKKASKKDNDMESKMVELKKEKDLDAILKQAAEQGKIVILDFFAEWCGPCKSMARVVDANIQEISEKSIFCKIDIDVLPEMSSSYYVRGVPTLVFLDNKGKEIKRLVGAQDKADLMKAINDCF